MHQASSNSSSIGHGTKFDLQMEKEGYSTLLLIISKHTIRIAHLFTITIYLPCELSTADFILLMFSINLKRVSFRFEILTLCLYFY